jgi:hypothetical protein
VQTPQKWPFLAQTTKFFGWLNQQSKLPEKLKNSTINMFLVANKPEKHQKSKFQQILGSGWCLHKISSIFHIFLAGQQSKITEKLKNSALNMFRVVNELEEQKFFLKTLKFQQILRSGWRLHGIFSSQIFLAGQQSNLTEKLKNSA